MGKIKTRLIKRTANTLMKEDIKFDGTFNRNKKILGREMPSKKVRNQIAGYIARLKRREDDEKKKIEESIKASKR
jgi:ribosomal protein S17E